MKSRVASRRALQAASTFAVVTTGSITLYAFKTTAGPPTTRAPLDAPSTPVPPKFPRIKSREEQVEALRRSGRTNTSTADPQAAENASLDGIYDLLIIGGGATGTGIALDAVTRGLKVALVERDDFSSGTSSKSTKLVHGGVRYLEKAVKGFDYEQFNLVRSALKERKYFLDIAPHLSCSLPLLVPIRRWWELPYMWAGAKLYDLLAGSERLQKSYFISRQRAFEYFPMLDNNRLLGALIYYDGQHNDSRTNVSLAVTAALYGATVLNYVEVTGLERDAQGKLCGARVCDLIPGPRPTLDAKGKGFVVRARGIINATGPFADELLRQDKKDCKEVVAPSSGVHVVLPEWLGPKNMGLVDPSSDGRVVFLLPWQGKIIAGTTDNACAVEKNPLPRDQDINWVLNEIQGLFCPGMEPQRSDVLASWAGIRPLARDIHAKNTKVLTRSHLITVSESGLLTCVGGKWTTYREMAEDAVNTAIDTFHLQPRGVAIRPNIGETTARDEDCLLDGSCQTHRLRLIGAHGYSKTLFVDLIKQFALEPDVAHHLAHSYGDRAWEVAALTSRVSVAGSKTPRLAQSYPYVDGEVRYAVRNEYARTVADVLARRTRLAFLDVKATLAALPAVIELMGEELQWSAETKKAEYGEAVRFLRSMGLGESPSGTLSVDYS